jgi:class 3 adenylate cyclase
VCSIQGAAVPRRRGACWFIQKTFGRYLSDDVVKTLLESPEGLNLGGEIRRVTMLMSDLRGFTSAAERLTAPQVVRMLNNFLGTMADIITSHRGTIEDVIGDEIVALFGAPFSAGDDAERRCLRDRHAARDGGRERAQRERRAAGNRDGHRSAHGRNRRRQHRLDDAGKI